jgi:hypothetical protein
MTDFPASTPRRGLARVACSVRDASRARQVVVASVLLALIATPLAVATSGGSMIGGKRNPGNNTSVEYSRETQIIGDIAQGRGGVARGTGGYATRQSNKSDSGGGAIYGCRARAGKNACLAADNLSDGAAFQFIAGSKSSHVGEILFSGHDKTPSSQPPFVTNGAGLVKNLNADTVDGKHATDLVDKAQLLFAVVDATGKVDNTRGATGASQSTGTPTPTYVVSFGSDVSKCAYTATPTDTAAGTLAVSTGSDSKSVVVTESGTASGFHLQVTC